MFIMEYTELTYSANTCNGASRLCKGISNQVRVHIQQAAHIDVSLP